MISIQQFDELMAEKGWVVFDSAIPSALVARMQHDIHDAYEICRQYQVKNGIEQDTSFTVHHLIGQFDSYLECLKAYPIYEFIERYFGGKFVLNSFGGAINTRDSISYAQRVHRDIRSYSGAIPLLLNTLVMLDDFTADNGSAGSQAERRIFPAACRTGHRPCRQYSDVQFQCVACRRKQ
jgi:hypothetical protein